MDVRDQELARRYARAAIEAVPARDKGRRDEIEHEVYEITHSDETPAQRVERRRGLVEAARRAGDVDLTVSCLTGLRIADLEAGNLGESDSVGEEYERYVQELRIPRYLAGVQQRRAMRGLLEGRFADAEAHAQAAVDLQPIVDFLEGYAVQLFAYPQRAESTVRDPAGGRGVDASRPASGVEHVIHHAAHRPR